MSPTIFRERGYRFYFFSREEARRHVHVFCTEVEAKYWLQPRIERAKSYGLSSQQLRRIEEMIREHEDELNRAWRRHFGN
ncbi:MAG: DUF4160 domain-containing protein [Gammaproteobacteria bacterium]|nr:DUF4160 domain-containing protein [Gammaproteobacteria bacterium]